MCVATNILQRVSLAQLIGTAVLGLALVTWAGCDTVGSSTDTTESIDDLTATLEPVSVGFGMVGAKALHATKASGDDTLTIESEAGVLAITDIRLIVSEMKLKVDD